MERMKKKKKKKRKRKRKEKKENCATVVPWISSTPTPLSVNFSFFVVSAEPSDHR